MGFAQYYREQGRKLAEQQGEALILRRQLTRRFGPLPEWAENKLTQASTDTLELWADRTMDAESLRRGVWGGLNAASTGGPQPSGR